MIGFLSPREKWIELRSARSLWPIQIQKKSENFFEKSSLPEWKTIQDFIFSLGFEPIPVRGYVGRQLYAAMIERKKMPICTRWTARPLISVPYSAPLDIFHDLGHSLACAMPDYRELLCLFAAIVGKDGKSMNSRKAEIGFKRFFEYAYVTGEKNFEPIGSVPMTFEWPRLKNGVPELSKEKRERARLDTRPFASRKIWFKEGRRFLQNLAVLR